MYIYDDYYAHPEKTIWLQKFLNNKLKKIIANFQKKLNWRRIK